MLAALEHWLGWLLTRYRIDQREIPICWPWHGELVEELSAQHTAHRAAGAPDGSPHGPANRHHTFALSRQRLQQDVARTGCRHGEHRGPTAVRAAAPPSE